MWYQTFSHLMSLLWNFAALTCLHHHCKSEHSNDSSCFGSGLVFGPKSKSHAQTQHEALSSLFISGIYLNTFYAFFFFFTLFMDFVHFICFYTHAVPKRRTREENWLHSNVQFRGAATYKIIFPITQATVYSPLADLVQVSDVSRARFLQPDGCVNTRGGGAGGKQGLRCTHFA